MNSREYKIKRESAKKLYLKGETDISALARIYGVADKTIRNWIKKGNWNDELDEIANLEDEIRIAVKKALIKALKEYARAPQDTALQSLVSLLRQYSKNIEPNRDFIEYMKKFLDWLIDFYLARNDEQTAMAIQMRAALSASRARLTSTALMRWTSRPLWFSLMTPLTILWQTPSAASSISMALHIQTIQASAT